jgi:hypothetical protein
MSSGTYYATFHVDQSGRPILNPPPPGLHDALVTPINISELRFSKPVLGRVDVIPTSGMRFEPERFR